MTTQSSGSTVRALELNRLDCAAVCIAVQRMMFDSLRYYERPLLISVPTDHDLGMYLRRYYSDATDGTCIARVESITVTQEGTVELGVRCVVNDSSDALKGTITLVLFNLNNPVTGGVFTYDLADLRKFGPSV